MSINLSEREFRDLGFAVDPKDPSRAVAASPQDEFVPDDSWDLDRLGSYAQAGLNKANRLQKESLQLGRRSTVEVYRAGRAISIASKKVKAQKWGQWGRWLAQHNLARTTAWEAAALYERAESEDAIRNLTPDQAKKKYNITRDWQNGKPQNSRPAPRSRPSDTESASNPEDGVDDGDDFDGRDEEEPSDDPEPEADELVKPPRTPRAMLAAVANLLFACEERSDELDETCKKILNEIVTVVARLLVKLNGATPIESASTDAVSTSDTREALPALPLLSAPNEALRSTCVKNFDAYVAECYDDNNTVSSLLAQIRSELERSGEIDALGDSPSEITQSR